MKTFTRSFDGTGNDIWTLPGGTYLRIMSAASAISVKVLRQGQEKAYFANVMAGVAWLSEDETGKLTAFDSVEITCSTIQSVTVAIGYGQLFDDATSGNVVATIVNGSALTASQVTVAASPAVSAQIIAADANRRAVTIFNNGSATLYIGGSASLTTANGLPVKAGFSLTLENSAPAGIWGISDGSSIDVRFLVEA